MLKVRFILLYRWLSRILPLKYKLSFLIRSYLQSDKSLVIPYYNNFNICIKRTIGNQRTISDLVFEGPRYLPEYSLVKQIKKDLGTDFVYVDVGSNIGTTLWLFASAAKTVYAFEPIPHLYQTIADSIKINNSKNILLVHKAIGAEVGLVNMLNNDNSNIVSAGEPNTIAIPVTTLDLELKQEQEIDLIKIDVEGFELNVLQGSVSLIKKHRPRLLIELHPGFIKNYGGDITVVINFLEGARYSISYYSFLNHWRLNRINRLVSRFFPSRGKKFVDKNDFFSDVSMEPSLSSYHLYCEPL